MEISLDRKRVELEGPQVNNLEEILLKVMSEHIEPGKVITAVRLNGTNYSEDNPHDAANVQLKEIKTLEIDTMSAGEMARHFLKNGAKHLELLIKGAEKISELFRISDETEANEQYAEYLENLRLFLRMIGECKTALGLNFTDLPFCGAPGEDQVQKLSSLTDQMLRVQEDEDWVMLADLLEYELIPLLKEWKENLAVLQEQENAPDPTESPGVFRPESP